MSALLEPTLRYARRGYQVAGASNGAGKIEWLGESTRTADEVAGNAGPPTRTDDCERWLETYLQSSVTATADSPHHARALEVGTAPPPRCTEPCASSH